MEKSSENSLPKTTNDFGKGLGGLFGPKTKTLGNMFWGKRSQIQKDRKKPQKSSKKLLTFLWDDDNIHKLTRAGHRRDGTEP